MTSEVLRRIIVCGAAVMALSVVACGSVKPLGPPSPAVSATVMKAEISAEVAFNTAVTTKNVAEAKGVLVGAKAAQADALAVQGYRYLCDPDGKGKCSLLSIRGLADAGVNPDLSNLTNLTGALVALVSK